MSEDLPNVFLITDRCPGGTHKLKLATKSVQLLSCVQVLIGLVSIGCQTSILVLFARYLDNVTTSEGIYCGLLYVASGLLGLVAANKLNSSIITATAVLSIISTIFGLHLFVFSSINILHWSHPWKRSYYKAKYSAPAWLFSLLYSSMLVCSVVEVMVAMASSLLCYRASGCCRANSGIPNIFYLSKEEDHGGMREGDNFSAVYAPQKNQDEGDRKDDREARNDVRGGSNENTGDRGESNTYGVGCNQDRGDSNKDRGGYNQNRGENNQDRGQKNEDRGDSNKYKGGCNKDRRVRNEDKGGYKKDVGGSMGYVNNALDIEHDYNGIDLKMNNTSAIDVIRNCP